MNTQDEDLLFPSVEIAENAREYLVSLQVPGGKRDDVRIEIRETNLVISSTHFRRSFAFSADVDERRIQANFIDGILEIVLPKIKVSPTRTIPIGNGRRKPVEAA